MPSLIDIRRRVRSVKNTQQITKAMKMVSAAKLRKAQEKAVAARPYAKAIQQMLANVAEAAAQSSDGETHPLLVVRPEKRILLVVLTADGGLAGGFNSNLIKLAHRFANEHKDAELSFELIGRKGRDYFKRRFPNIAGEHLDVFRVVKFETAEKIAQAIIDRFAKAEIDAVYLFVNEFKSVMSSNIAMTRLLPIEVPKSATPVDYIYEQKPEELLGSLLPRYLNVQIYRALLESAAAYLAARMTAMDAATRNADDVIDKLTLYMNRVRQASITREIIEVVSGAAALE
jgi:F-type H+-transporting ATPase subunit gamma